MTAHSQFLAITNDPAGLPQVRELVKQVVERGGFPGRYLNRLQLAVDEAVTNIIEHGYANHPAGAANIELRASADGECFRVEVEDEGVSFEPEKIGEVDVVAHVAKGRSGGLGVFLIRKVMDLIEYHYETGKKNQLVLVKYRDKK